MFYPKPRPRGFDELGFYADRFRTVEVNSTFYGQPRPDVTRAWTQKTPAGFMFSVKLYQQFTHPRMFRQRVVTDLARQLGTTDIPESAVRALIAANAADLDEFKRGIGPLADAGKLGPLLAQFPASFKADSASRAHLAALLGAFGEYTVAVELRHRTWSDARADTVALLNAFGAAWVQIDEPKFEDSIVQDLAPTEAPIYYLRLHGRNAAAWWRHAKPEDRYDYLYSAEELNPLAANVVGAARAGKAVFAYTNNHKNAQAIVNAEQLVEITKAFESPHAEDVGDRQGVRRGHT
jgi:uncharacterized protein YecE (DUF72 family)